MTSVTMNMAGFMDAIIFMSLHFALVAYGIIFLPLILTGKFKKPHFYLIAATFNIIFIYVIVYLLGLDSDGPYNKYLYLELGLVIFVFIIQSMVYFEIYTKFLPIKLNKYQSNAKSKIALSAVYSVYIAALFVISYGLLPNLFNVIFYLNALLNGLLHYVLNMFLSNISSTVLIPLYGMALVGGLYLGKISAYAYNSNWRLFNTRIKFYILSYIVFFILFFVANRFEYNITRAIHAAGFIALSAMIFGFRLKTKTLA